MAFFSKSGSLHSILCMHFHALKIWVFGLLKFNILGDHPNFFRMMCTAPHGTEADMRFILDEIHRLGEDL